MYDNVCTLTFDKVMVISVSLLKVEIDLANSICTTMKDKSIADPTYVAGYQELCRTYCNVAIVCVQSKKKALKIQGPSHGEYIICPLCSSCQTEMTKKENQQ